MIAITNAWGEKRLIPSSDSPELGTTFDTRGKTMKKVLLATTALAMSAGVAYAEISISGNARMGLQHVGKVAGKDAVQGTISAANAALINEYLGSNAVDADELVTADYVRQAQELRQEWADALAAMEAAQDPADAVAMAELAADLESLDAVIAESSGSAAVAAKDSTTKYEKRMTVTMSGSVETTSGLTFGATLNLRANEGKAAVGSGARVHMATGGVEVGVGNIWGAIDSMPGVYSASAGLTGLGWGGALANTDATGYWGWDSYSSSGNGAEGVEVTFSSGSFAGHLSYTSTDLGSNANRTAGYVAYTMGDWTVAVGSQYDADNADNDKTLVTVGGKVGDFGVGIGYADNGGETKLALNGSASFGATSVSAYLADEESAANASMGLGISHDLGGASLTGGIAKTASGQTRADMGVSFSF
jgi:outer membrane protein OmpU